MKHIGEILRENMRQVASRLDMLSTDATEEGLRHLAQWLFSIYATAHVHVCKDAAYKNVWTCVVSDSHIEESRNQEYVFRAVGKKNVMRDCALFLSAAIKDRGLLLFEPPK